MFFHYHQNNSGGDFTLDPKRGLSVNVLIEADSASAADSIAQGSGIYFDGCDTGMDCSCCGDRWNRAYGSGESEPTLYGKVVVPNQNAPAPGGDSLFTKWLEEGQPEGFIHYLDGTVEGFYQVSDERTDLDGSNGWGVQFNRFGTEMFIVGNNGWSECGNLQAASKVKSKGYNSDWVKPVSPTVHYYDGYGRAWFPSKVGAEAFVSEVKEKDKKIRQAIKGAVDSKFASIWLKG